MSLICPILYELYLTHLVACILHFLHDLPDECDLLVAEAGADVGIGAWAGIVGDVCTVDDTGTGGGIAQGRACIGVVCLVGFQQVTPAESFHWVLNKV